MSETRSQSTSDPLWGETGPSTALQQIGALLSRAIPLDVALAPDGTRVYVTNSRGSSISVIDVQSLTEARRFGESARGLHQTQLCIGQLFLQRGDVRAQQRGQVGIDARRFTAGQQA